MSDNTWSSGVLAGSPTRLPPSQATGNRQPRFKYIHLFAEISQPSSQTGWRRFTLGPLRTFHIDSKCVLPFCSLAYLRPSKQRHQPDARCEIAGSGDDQRQDHFANRARPWLAQRPIEHNPLLSLLAELQTDTGATGRDAPLCIEANDGGELVGVGFRESSDWPLLLRRPPSKSSDRGNRVTVSTGLAGAHSSLHFVRRDDSSHLRCQNRAQRTGRDM